MLFSAGPIVLFDKVLIPQVRGFCCTQRIHQGKRSKSELLVDNFPSSSPLPTVHRPEHRDPFKPHRFVERLGPQTSFSSLSNTLCQAENAPPKKKPRCLPNNDLTTHSTTQHNTHTHTHTQHTLTQTPTQAPHTHFHFLSRRFCLDEYYSKLVFALKTRLEKAPRHSISDAHAWITEIHTVPICFLA